MSELFGPSSPSLTGRAVVIVIHGDELGRKHVLDARETTIGSAPGSDIRLSHESVSPRHAVITSSDQVRRIEDAGSNGGTWVNDRRIDGPTTLADGDLVRIGRVVFKLLAGDNVESAYHEEIYRLATTDDITTAFTKRYLVDTLEREVSRARRYQRRLSLVMLGIDGFKPCNDEFGHRAGDHVLRRTTELVREKARKVDVIGRYRGDELALLLPDLDLRGAAELAEAIREEIERHRFEHEGREIAITLSLGVAMLEPELTGGEALVDVAYARMRRAKERGRNRVVASDDDEAEAALAKGEGPASEPT